MTIRAVFFHIERGSYGGGAQMLRRLLASLPEDQFDPVLLTQERGRLAREVEEAGVEVQIVPFEGALDTYDQGLLEAPPWRLVSVAYRIVQFDLEARTVLKDADVVWCQNLRALLTLLPFALLTRTAFIWNIGLGLPSTGKVRYLNEVAFRACDRAFIESSEQIRRVFTPAQCRKFEDKFVVFHKGIDTDIFDSESIDAENIDEQTVSIGTAGSLVPRKGHDVFVEAAARIVDRYDGEVEFFIAGAVPENNDSSYRGALEELIAENGLDDRVTFLGWVEDMPEFYESMDIFVLASNNEGIPGVVREAMAMKTPVVATDVGGTAEAVLDGETGFLVETGDSDAIADASLDILNDSERAEAFAERSREHIREHFSIESYVESYVSFLQDLHESSDDPSL